MALVLTYRSGFVYSAALRSKTGVGLFGYDTQLTEAYARRPIQALRDAPITRALTLTFQMQADSQLEKLRRTYAVSLLLTMGFAFFGLALF